MADISVSNEEQYDIAEPRADAMIQSLRSVGYDLPTAVADLIDNSIAASARNIWLDMYWDGGASVLTLLDDGNGMSEQELIAAMRPGSRNPLDKRDPKDLGRFGLGLKTASFSQAKRLIVATKKKAGTVAVRCWDLDYVTRNNDWRLLRRGSPMFESRVLPLLKSLANGTVVAWEEMDRVVGTEVHTNDLVAQEHFLNRAEQVSRHLAMVFHRFLELPPRRALKIYVNGVPVRPWNPFFPEHAATQLLTEEALPLFGSKMDVRPYVLPHHTKMTQEEHKAASGLKGWNAHQGFYIYRNDRLLVAGDWLGMGFLQEEHYKLARISVDIPNNMDASWEIDVKKSRAWPPAVIKSDLKRLATATRSRAADIYRHRGARLVGGRVQEMTFLWERKVRRSKIFYEINRNHPLVRGALSAGGAAGASVRSLLHLIEETVPVPTIVQDGVESPTKLSVPFEEAAPTALRDALRQTFLMLTASGLSSSQAKLKMINTEPFDRFREMVAALGENYDPEPGENDEQ